MTHDITHVPISFAVGRRDVRALIQSLRSRDSTEAFAVSGRAQIGRAVGKDRG